MTWLRFNWQYALDLAGQHLLLCLPAIVISALIATPLGWYAWSRPRWGRPLILAATLLYAIPALPLLIVIPLFIGTPLRSSATMIAALSVYGVALLAGTARDAFASVDPRVREAAVALGHTPRSALWRVELPLALPVLLSGLRVVVVSSIGLVTMGALVGVPSLGTLLTDGFQRGIAAEVAVGMLATVILSLLLDSLVLAASRLLLPWRRAVSKATA